MSQSLTLTLPIELTNGNSGRGHAFWNSAKERKAYEEIIRTKFPRQRPFGVPVVVTVTRVLGRKQRLWDSSSILRGNYKEVEDALVACGFFHDDGPRWIRATHGLQDASRRKD